MKINESKEFFYKAVLAANKTTYSLHPIGIDNDESPEVKSLPIELLRLNSWDVSSLNYPNLEISGWPLDKKSSRLEQKFYEQKDEWLFGEDKETGKTILGRLYGQRSRDFYLKDAVLGLRVFSIKFEDINVFNCPTPEHAYYWEKALKTKWWAISKKAA